MSWSQIELARIAAEGRLRAYTPYSQFAVGSAVVCTDGVVFQGCNVENVSYGLTVCAERTVIFAAVAAGYRKIEALAVSAVPSVYPCGACLQVLAEFAGPECPVIIAEEERIVGCNTLGQLLPQAFTAPFLFRKRDQ